MSGIWLVLALVVVAGLVFSARTRQSGSREWPLTAVPVMSRPEQTLYWRLIEALPDHIVLAQVQLSRLMQVGQVKQRQAVLNRIDRKSADFVVCSKDAQPLCVIELDDSSHRARRRQKSDADKDAALQAAGIGVLRFQVKALPDVEAIRTAAIAVVSPVAV